MPTRIKLSAISSVILGDLETFAKTMAIECSNTVISRTPVDSGSLVDSYHMSSGNTNAPFRKIDKRRVDPGSARNKQMNTIEREAEAMSGYRYKLQTEAPYALEVHHADYLVTGQLRFMNLSGPDISRAKAIAVRATK